jgi:hypothetical protein
MKLSSCTAACGIVFLLLAPLAAFGDELTPAQVEAQLATHGVAKTLEKYQASMDEWLEVLAGIEEGDPAWLRIAAKLAAEADEGSAEDLRFTLGLALTRHAAAIFKEALPALRKFGVADVCSAVSYNEETPLDEISKELRTRVNALAELGPGPEQATCLKAAGSALEKFWNSEASEALTSEGADASAPSLLDTLLDGILNPSEDDE